jgi:hypothetical protein
MIITDIKKLADKKIQDYKKDENYNDLVERSKKLFEYFKENPLLLPQDFERNLKVLSSRFKRFSENLKEVMTSKYRIAKAFDIKP